MTFLVFYSRDGIESAQYIPVEIKNEPETNCLQPTPVTQKWQNVCVKEDLYCFDFRDIYTSGMAGLKEQLDTIMSRINLCINSD